MILFVVILSSVVAVLYAARKTWPVGVLRLVYELVYMLVTVKMHQLFNTGTSWSVVDVIEQMIDRNPNGAQFITVETGEVTTAIMVESLANKFAYWGKHVAGN
jgi:hypothetical protein